MKFRPTPVACAAALVLMAPWLAQAQQTPAPPAPEAKPSAERSTTLETVTVTGIRASLEQALNKKRNADSHVEVVSAEDIGKMPDKNVADAVQRLPGVNISSGSTGSGGFAENDHVSIRGTSPSLTQTTINGHLVGTGDWFVLDQVGTVGRSVSYELLPSEIVSSATVIKASQADQVEGGVSGSVNLETRRPLGFKKQFTAEVAVQAIHSSLSAKTDPQMNALFNWKNEASSAGVLLHVFTESRHDRRDGQEFFGYSAIDPQNDVDGKPTNRVVIADPKLAGVLVPQGINQALFEQKRKRTGAVLDVEFKPTSALTLDANGFYSKLEASNYNRSFYAIPANNVNATDPAGKSISVIPTNYLVQNNVLVKADFPLANYQASQALMTQYQIANGLPQLPNQSVAPGVVDQIYRPGSGSETYFLDLNGKYRASDKLLLSGSVGYTHGVGKTPGDIGFEANLPNSGVAYTLHGMAPADLSFAGADPSNPAGSAPAAGWGSNITAIDSESWAKADAEWQLDSGMFESVKFGARFSQHTRQVKWPENRACNACNGVVNPPPPGTPANVAMPVWAGGTYPSNFGSGLGNNSGMPKNVWQINPGDILAWAAANDTAQGPTTEAWPFEFTLKEKVVAAYAMANLGGDKWRGNVGVRLVQTRQHALNGVIVPIDPATGFLPNPLPAGTLGFTTDSDGNFVPSNVNGAYVLDPRSHTYTDILPSANFKFDLSKDLVARFAVAKTMARADYSSLVGAITSLDDTLHTGTGGNPDLKPIRSTNYDATLEWYFAPKSLLSASVFLMDLSSYVGFGSGIQILNDNTHHVKNVAYSIDSPVNTSAKVRGLELGYQQSLGGGFGTVINYTYANGKAVDPTGGSATEVVGNSRNTYNLTGFYENDRFSARLAWSYRSSFLSGLFNSSPQHQDAVGTMAASLSYKINDRFSLTFDGLNLNNPVIKSYGSDRTQPVSLYSNGRQFYFGVRAQL